MKKIEAPNFSRHFNFSGAFFRIEAPDDRSGSARSDKSGQALFVYVSSKKRIFCDAIPESPAPLAFPYEVRTPTQAPEAGYIRSLLRHSFSKSAAANSGIRLPENSESRSLA